MKRSEITRKTPMPRGNCELARTGIARRGFDAVKAVAKKCAATMFGWPEPEPVPELDTAAAPMPPARAPIRKMSKKRMKQAKARAVCRQIVMERDGRRCRLGIIGICTGAATDVHEVLTRKRGGSIVDPDNCLAACRACHDFVHHGDPIAATALGLLQSGHRPIDPVANAAPSQRFGGTA